MSPVLAASAASTPPTSTAPSPETLPEHTYNDPLDDIFSSSPSPPSLHSYLADPLNPRSPASTDAVSREALLSDLPALRRQHVTAGYREGLAVSKAKTIQYGFDDGYSIGVIVGMRVGRVLGAIEGIASALEKADYENFEKVKRILDKAKREVGQVGLFLQGITDEDLGKDMNAKEKAIDGEEDVKADAGLNAGSEILAKDAIKSLEFWEKALRRVLPSGQAQKAD